MKFTADFETCTWLENETYVWAWAICDIDNPNNVQIGKSIESFMEYCKKEVNSTYFFHNLKFDGEFIIYYLLSHGFEHITDRKERKNKTFSTLISDMGMFYTIEVFFEVGNKKVKKVKFVDSLKIIPFSVDVIAKSFGLPISKLKIDYNKFREVGHNLTDEEKEYIKNDVKIVAYALKVLFDEDLTKITMGSNAVMNFKQTHSGAKLKRMFPSLSYELDKDLRSAYKGGFTYLNPIYKEKNLGRTFVLDVNSLYPSVMYEKLLPIGEPIYFEGKYKEDKVYPLYIQRISCSFEIKKNKIPTIQIKKAQFMDNEYLTSSNNEIVSLTLSNIDLKLFLEQYDVYDLTYHCGWKFKGMHGIFKDYIDKWIARKIEATKQGNKGQRTLAKLFLNSLYGKFATSLDVQGKIPYIEDGIVKYKLSEKEQKEGFYLPIGIFITSYAREKTIRTSQSIKDYSINKYGKDLYYYSDTDSIHTGLPIEELVQFCEIDDTALGKWAHEGTAIRSKFVRQKCYLEEFENDGEKEIKITCAGMPKSCYKYVEWETFKEGFTCGGKLTFKHVKGGVKLVETEFTIKHDKKLTNNIKNF